ncbi:MAG: glycosyltransferase, partial [Bdellovibrionales bacterium]|nr:glycosyltransferase [Bdellovibrionales bacterium]
YGIAAYPKKHTPENIPELYQIAAKTGGVFVNPALTEPFGLTLIEAAASGLPVVATNDGGPRDIIDTCKHGVLIDPHDASALGEALADAISNRPRWKKWSQNARTRALQEYTWEGHVTKYISELEELHFHRELPRSHYPKGNLTKFNRLLVTHIRGIFQGEDRARQELIDLIQSNRENLGICVSTRLNREEALQKIDEIDGPRPDFLICSSGSEIFSGPELVVDKSWEKQIDFRWDREQIKELVRSLPDLSIDESEQRYFRITLSADANSTTMRKDIRKLLRQHNLYANVVYSYDHLFDILPIRATTGHALRHVSLKWGIPAKAIIVCRYQTGDESMLLGSSQGVVLGVPDSLTEQLRGSPHIFFARQSGASGVLAGIRHFQFLSSFTEHETYL